jgi:hypothetical protein
MMVRSPITAPIHSEELWASFATEENPTNDLLGSPSHGYRSKGLPSNRGPLEPPPRRQVDSKRPRNVTVRIAQWFLTGICDVGSFGSRGRALTIEASHKGSHFTLILQRFRIEFVAIRNIQWDQYQSLPAGFARGLIVREVGVAGIFRRPTIEESERFGSERHPILARGNRRAVRTGNRE